MSFNSLNNKFNEQTFQTVMWVVQLITILLPYNCFACHILIVYVNKKTLLDYLNNFPDADFSLF